jgi:hypothetical protein
MSYLNSRLNTQHSTLAAITMAVLVLTGFTTAGAQEVDLPLPTAAHELLLPDFLRIGYQTRAWVREELPPASDSLPDLDRMDLIYRRAIVESEGEIGHALLASLIATFEHRTIPLSFGLDLPLTLEPQELFDRRVERLPRSLFADLAHGDDRDKLQHFFASAWLTWGLDNRSVADVIGLGVETGEDLIVRGGLDDPRDVRANRLGQLFAVLLRSHPDALPSQIFRAWNREYLRRARETE